MKYFTSYGTIASMSFVFHLLIYEVTHRDFVRTNWGSYKNNLWSLFHNKTPKMKYLKFTAELKIFPHFPHRYLRTPS